MKDVKKKNKEENRKRDKRITIRLDDDEMDIIKIQKEKAGIKSYREFFLMLALHGVIYKINVQPFMELSRNVSQIGNNINQLIKKINVNNRVYDEDIQHIKRDVDEIKERVFKVINFINYIDNVMPLSKKKGGSRYGNIEKNTD